MLKKAAIIVLLAVGVQIIKWYMNGSMCDSADRIDGQVVVLTGANTGLGKETAEQLLQRGGKVYMTCRSMERCHQAARDIKSRVDVGEDRLLVMRLDLASLKSVREFVTEFKKYENHIDVLVNNAGVMMVPEGKTEDGFEVTFGVNHLGHFLLTHLLMDLIVDDNRPSRIVNVAAKLYEYGEIDFDDLMYTKGYSRFGAYCRSKLANLLFTRELARRLAGTKVTTYSLHPGVIATELGRDFPILSEYAIARHLYSILSWPFLKTAWYGVQTTVCCAVDSRLSTQSGKYYRDCSEETPTAVALDDATALKLWNVSIELVKLQPSEIHEKLRE